MSDIGFIEKSAIESFLGMKSGYVLDFSDRTFQEFVGEYTGEDILSDKYNYASNSKANRFRAFMKIATNQLVGKLLSGLCSYWLAKVHAGDFNYHGDEKKYEACVKIAESLIQDGAIIENIDALKPNSNDRDFNLLAKSIKESIEKNEPEVALDRLHTFVVKYVRQLCENHGIEQKRDEPINSLFGKYVKHLMQEKLIDSVMAEKILKFSINIIDAFNDVRNNKSLAHDNPILNYDESILIFNNISNTIKFIEKIENRIIRSKEPEKTIWDDLSF